ncbi:hypothetical protein HNQ34_003422 [Anoxybacillus tepidamans]|uniref:YqzH n=1 Tax=Anoxybacteroides tepidamans TaxID=265948 RepID=A0A7W8ITA2_9BACL|nr:YqzH family protein [Anoxybacillus tepidamans]MBB5326288.1 hypothetical protein [Anoxybacillus tepidamans]
MNEKWLKKFVRNCLRQYGRDTEAFPLTDSEWADLYQNILLEKQTNPDMDIYEVVHDVVYEYVTK